MAFQDSCGTIIIDAALTDIGRQKLARSDFKISKFALGDDEVDYVFGNSDSGTWLPGWDTSPTSDGTAYPPILEAGTSDDSNIRYGLISLPRQDVTHLPRLLINEIVRDSAIRNNSSQKYYLSVNDETTKKLIQTGLLSDRLVLENNQTSRNFIFVESGISTNDTEDISIPANAATKERYITNLGLMDQYMFIYCDGRFVDKLLTNGKDSHLRNDAADNLYLSVVPLVESIKISLGSAIENYETYRMSTINNEIFDPSTYSAFNGPKACAMAFNIKLNDRLVGTSESAPDERYVSFGTLSADLLGDGDMYDYIDTNILVEGATTGNQLVVEVRIVRYAGT